MMVSPSFGKDAPDILMEPRLAALNLFLDALGILPQISTMRARKTLQKAVYLGQLTGVDLGYRFGWYLRGPYSPELAKAYYQMAEAIGSGEKPQGTLRPSLRQRLNAVRQLMTPPASVALGQPEWLELLASWHYLRTVRKLSRTSAKETIKAEKASLLPYVVETETTLKQAGVLG